MVGWFALNLPAGLSLYYFSNTVLTSGQQIFLRKLGGARLAEFDLGPIELGKARRSGALASSEAEEAPAAMEAITAGADGTGSSGNGAAMAFTEGAEAAAEATVEAAVVSGVPTINRRCKRKKRELLEA